MNTELYAFIKESNRIEGIHRDPIDGEITLSENFLNLPRLTLEDILTIQSAYAPGKPLRDKAGMDVRVGNHIPERGGPQIRVGLQLILDNIAAGKADAWKTHIDFETLHPFMDGNGRTGRILWAWQMSSYGHSPFALPFLHRFYYQTLDNVGR